MTDTQELLPVTQEDRKAAAAYYYSAGGSPNIAREIEEGRKDTWFRVQSFARHRELSLSSAKMEIAALREALLKCGLVIGRYNDLLGPQRSDGSARIGAVLSREEVQASLVAANAARAALGDQS